jgi:anti-sigma B factor antagonist
MQDISKDELNVAIEQVGSAAVVTLDGEVHLPGADLLKGYLLELVTEKIPRMVLDLTTVGFLGSAGLGVIVLAHIKARTFRGEFRLVSPRPKVMRALEVTRLTKLFNIYDSVDEALAD